MKNFFKFIPVALAGFALASCSSDDLNVLDGNQELTYSPNRLMVQVGDFDDATRGGFMTTVYDYNLKSALFFNTGDQMKLYHDATSWKKEIWTATAFGQYKNAQGIAVFEGPDPESTIVTSEDAYGIFPASIGQFGNEDRTSIQYDLSAMKFIDYNAQATKYVGNGFVVDNTAADPKDYQDKTDNTKAYAAPFPLWGVKKAGSELMTVQHLAGILRVDMAHLDLAGMGVNDAKFIIIKSNNVLSGKVATAADLLNPTADEALKVDVANLMTKAPKLVTKPATSLTEIQSPTFPITAGGIKEDVIVVKLTKDDPEHVMLFVPITAGNAGGNIDIYVSSVYNLAGSPASIDTYSDAELAAPKYTLTAEKIADENDLQVKSKAGKDLTKVQPGVFYRINDDTSNIDHDARTPFQLAEGIIKADKNAYRDFDLYIENPIEVKNNDDSPQNFWVNLAGGDDRYGLAEGWALKHNVTVHLTLKESDDAGSVPSVLYIKTKEGSKKLTLKIRNHDTKKVDKIVIKDNCLKSELVLKEEISSTKLPYIEIGEGNYDATEGAEKDYLTLAAGAQSVIAQSNFTITTTTGSSDNIDELTIGKGMKKLTIKGGRISNIYLANGDKKINADATIYSEGNVSINSINYANMPQVNNKDAHNIVYESLYTGACIPTFATATITNGTKIIGNCVVTAAQLSKMTAGTDFTVIGTFDLGGANDVAWTSLDLTNSVYGAQYFRNETNDKANATITGVATIKNLKGENGLLANWTPSSITTPGDVISNITFAGRNTVAKKGENSKGLLVGTVKMITTGVKPATIKNITLNGTNEIQNLTDGKDAGSYSIGGVIGKTTGTEAALQLANVVVGANTNVYGFKNVGGIIGEVAGKVIFGMQKADGTDKFTIAAKVESGDKPNKCLASIDNLHTIMVNNAPMSPNLPTIGKFFGSATVAAAGDLQIFGALTTSSPARTADKWGYYLNDKNSEYWSWTATLYYDEIGHCGYADPASDGEGNIVVAVNGAFKGVDVYTSSTDANPTYSSKTTYVPNVGKTEPIASAHAFGWVKRPY